VNDHSAAGSSAAVAPDGSFVAVGFADGGLRTYALPKTVIGSSTASPSSKGIAGEGDATGRQPIVEIADAHGAKGVRRIDVNADGETLATEGWDGAVNLWRVASSTGGLVLSLVLTLDDHAMPKFSQNGRGLAVIRRFDVKRRLFDVGVGQWRNVTSDNFESLEVPEAEARTRFGSFEKGVDTARDIVTSRIKLRDYISATISDDGKQLAVVGRGASKVTLYDLGREQGKPEHLVGHENTVFEAIFGPDGHQLATVSVDKTVRLWDLDSDKELYSQRLPDAAATIDDKSPHDFDFQCRPEGDCWVAVPLNIGRLAIYRLPYLQPPESIRLGSAARTDQQAAGPAQSGSGTRPGLALNPGAQ